MMEQVRLGFVGIGGWGTRLARTASAVEGLVVAAGCARDEGRRSAFAESFGCPVTGDLEEMLGGDLDAIVIATPHSTHRSLVERVCAAGRHVLVEKPLALTVEDARACVTAARSAGVVLQVGHQRRLLPANAALRNWVGSGELGDLALIQATITSPNGLSARPGWQSDPAERPLGGMTGLGVHMVDTLLAIAGPVATVAAASRAPGVPGPIDTVTTLQLELASGALGQIATSTIAARVATVAAFGTRGSAWSEDDGTRLFRQDVADGTRVEVPVQGVDALEAQLAAFAAHVREGSRPEMDGEAGLAVVRVMAAAQESVVRGGAPVPITDVG